MGKRIFFLFLLLPFGIVLAAPGDLSLVVSSTEPYSNGGNEVCNFDEISNNNSAILYSYKNYNPLLIFVRYHISFCFPHYVLTYLFYILLKNK